MHLRSLSFIRNDRQEYIRARNTYMSEVPILPDLQGRDRPTEEKLG